MTYYRLFYIQQNKMKRSRYLYKYMFLSTCVLDLWTDTELIILAAFNFASLLTGVRVCYYEKGEQHFNKK